VGLFINLMGYCAVFLPGLLILNYVKKTGYLDRGPHSCLGPLVKLCFFGSEETIDDSIAKDEHNNSHVEKKPVASNKNSDLKVFLNLIFCFIGLQISYLTWGVLQEKIMTRKYEDSAGNVGLFKDSQFLVFVNRVLAFAVALLYITFSRQPRHRAPIYKYSFCSFSNIMSSWCQYEALKFVSFPTQVLILLRRILCLRNKCLKILERLLILHYLY
jgi:adenosine 3'-phospho 5'-phosphosulfate transporter B2